MALWTDPSRQYLITCIRARQILWDRNYTSDQNYRTSKNIAFQEVTSDLNNMFPMNTKFTGEDVRSQWKNLKDTFVRKLRWVTEGKYSEDPTKEPTWKFYRMLLFLDEKEAKRLNSEGQTNDQNGYDIGMHRNQQSMHMKAEMPDMTHSMHYENSNHSATSSEEQMLQMFPPPIQSVSPPSSSIPMSVSAVPCSTETICAKPSYTPPSSQTVGSSAHQTDDDEEPRRKRPYHRRQVSSNAISNGMQDEFDLFGACVAAQLKRICEEHNRGEAVRLQKKINDIMFENQLKLMEQ